MRWRVDVMQHFLKGGNVGIYLCRQIFSDGYSHIFLINKIVDDSFVSNKSIERVMYFHCTYMWKTTGKIFGHQLERIPNLNVDFVSQIEDELGLTFTSEKEATKDSFARNDILD